MEWMRIALTYLLASVILRTGGLAIAVVYM